VFAAIIPAGPSAAGRLGFRNTQWHAVKLEKPYNVNLHQHVIGSNSYAYRGIRFGIRIYAAHRFGESIKTAQSLLGHSDLGTTLNTYAHVIPDSQRRAVERVSEVLFSSVLKLGEKS